MSVEYSGSIVQNEAYKVKKVQAQLNALQISYCNATAENEVLKAQYAELLDRYDRSRNSEERKAKPKAPKVKPAPKPKPKPRFVNGKPRRKTVKELEELRAQGLAAPAKPRKKTIE